MNINAILGSFIFNEPTLSCFIDLTLFVPVSNGLTYVFTREVIVLFLATEYIIF